MPKLGTVGVSSFTQSKQRSLEYVVSALVPMVGSIQTRHDWASGESLWVDLFAGPGRYPDDDTGYEILGSPIILMRALKAERQRSPAFTPRLILIESKRCCADRLRLEVEREDCDFAEVLDCDCCEWLCSRPKLGSETFGLVYSDPNGMPPSDALAEFYQDRRHTWRLDCLLYTSANTIKRVRRCHEVTGSPHDGRTLLEHTNAIGKSKTYIRRPLGGDYWTHLLLTNSPIVWNLRSAGLYDIESERGKEILDDCNRTRLERLEEPAGSPSTQLLLWG